jgi:23S rRNA (guanosine2251-2'-O)-methyltransferase
VADLGPLVIKASAGVAFTAPIRRAATAGEAVDRLRADGFTVYGLAAGVGRSLFDPAPLASRAAFVLGNETDGVRVPVDGTVSIPMAGEVESLNVAVAAGVLCFELVRRRLSP